MKAAVVPEAAVVVEPPEAAVVLEPLGAAVVVEPPEAGVVVVELGDEPPHAVATMATTARPAIT
ncbi:MAG: hypothetical protein ACRD0L_03670 [Acidimicrobiales bacterium]